MKIANFTSDLSIIVDECNRTVNSIDIDRSKYILSVTEDGRPLITNVPDSIYNLHYQKKYKPPQNISGIEIKILEIQHYIDQLQLNDARQIFPNETEAASFQLNKCYINSLRFIRYFKHLQKDRYIPKKIKIELVLGYVESYIYRGSTIGNIVTENKKITIHDWHVWNYYNNLLVDLSLFKEGNRLLIGSNLLWGKAADHVFYNTPPNTTYFGRRFSDINKFKSEVKKHFDLKP